MKYVICSQDRRSPKYVEYYTNKHKTWLWSPMVEEAMVFDTQKKAIEYLSDNWPLFPANDSSSIYYVDAV